MSLSRRSRLALLITEVYCILMSHGSLTERARAGVVMIRVSAAVKTASNAAVYLASRPLIRNFRPSILDGMQWQPLQER